MRIAVTSGKGGTGKTTLATGLALALAGETSVLLIDCDVEAPNAHLFMRPRIVDRVGTGLPVPEVDEDRCTFCGRCAEVCQFNAIAVAEEVVLTFHER